MNKTNNHDLGTEIQQESNPECNASGQYDEQDLVCKGCKTRFANFVDHVNHSCHPHRCSLCNRLFQGGYELRLHKKMAHRRGTKVNDTLNISLSSAFNQGIEYGSTATRRYFCEICDRPLKNKQAFCKNCLLTINREGVYNLRDKSGNNSAAIFSPDETTITEDISGQLLKRSNSCSDISEVLEVKVDLVNSKDATNTVFDEANEESEKEDTVTEGKSNMNLSEKTLAQNVKLERLRNQIGHDISSAGIRLSRKRMLDSDDRNSVPTLKSNLQIAEGHKRGRTSKKVRNSSPVSPVKKSDMVQIDTLIRSLPDDCGILIKPCNDDASIFRCPKCSKVFRNFRLGSAHYSLCPKNIECSKNRKTLVSSSDVVWVCSLCHLSFSHLSQLTQHKNSCLTTESSKASRSSANGFEYKSGFRRCPKCCFECVSLIKYQDHPCEKMIEQYHSVIVPLKRIRELPEGYSGSYIYFECVCKQIFHSRHFFNQHLQLHPHAKTRDCVRTLYIACNPPQKKDGNHILPVIKKEVSSNDEDYPNNAQNTSIAPSVPQTGQSCSRPRKKKKLATHVPPEQAQESHSFSRIPSNNLQSLNRSRSRRRSVATETIGNDIAENLCESANSNNDQSFLSMDHASCTCKTDNSDEDVKPCLKCLAELLRQRAMSNSETNTDYARLKREVQEAIRSLTTNDDEEEPLETDNESLDPQNPTELDLGLTLGYENSDIALQLIQDLQAIPTPPPFNHKYLTPPATPDSFNVQSPSHCSATKESCIPSTKYDNQAGPSGLNQSPNDLASISLEKPFTDSSEFIARINESAPFQTQTEVFPSFQSQTELSLSFQSQAESSLSFQPQTEPSLPFQPHTEPLLTFRPQAEPSLPFQPQAEPSFPFQSQAEPSLPFQSQAEHSLSFQPQAEPSLSFQPQAEPSLSFQSQAEPSLPYQPQAEPSLPFQPSAFEPVNEETLPTVELTVEREPIPVPPNIRHIHVSKERVIPDAYAMTASDNETVRRYICHHCMLDFQIDSLTDHLQNKVGKAPSEEILAIYVCEED